MVEVKAGFAVCKAQINAVTLSPEFFILQELFKPAPPQGAYNHGCLLVLKATQSVSYIPGDIGYCTEDGAWFIIDRKKELIKFKGYQVPYYINCIT